MSQKPVGTRTRRYPLIGPYNSTSNQFAAGDNSSPVMTNLLIGPSGELYPRPGYFKTTYACPAITGATEQKLVDSWVWPERGLLIVGISYKHTGTYRYTLAAMALSTGTFTALDVAAPVVTSGKTDRFSFAANQYWVYVANGGDVLCWDGSLASFKKAASCPSTAASHVAFIDGMIVCNKTGTNEFYFAEPDPAGYSNELVWNVTGLTAEAKGDTISAIHAGWRELLIQGQQSTEVWINTGNADTVFERQDGAYIEHGLGAPYSVVCKEGTWYWIDDQNQFVRMRGRQVEVLSEPIRKEILEYLPIGTYLSTILKDISCRILRLIKKDLIVIRMLGITGGATNFVWDESDKTWVKWAFPVSHEVHAFSRSVDRDFVYSVMSDYYTGDLYVRMFERATTAPTTRVMAVTDDCAFDGTGGTAITSTYSTPHIDHGTGGVKRCRRFTITGNGTMTINWYDDGALASSGSESVTLVNEAMTLFRLGTYRTRRWSIAISGTDPVLRSIEEDIEDLG